MRFQKAFFRYATGGSYSGNISPISALGSDAAPTTTPPGVTADNVISIMPMSLAAGLPVKNLAIAFNSTGATALQCDVYYWEDTTQSWYLLTPNHLLLGSGSIVLVPVPVVSPPPPIKPYQGAATAGGMSLMVVPGANTTAGLYTFALAPSLT